MCWPSAAESNRCARRMRPRFASTFSVFLSFFLFKFSSSRKNTVRREDLNRRKQRKTERNQQEFSPTKNSKFLIPRYSGRILSGDHHGDSVQLPKMPTRIQR